jgi:hypothetical protein
MSEFGIPQDSHEWAEKKHLLRFCDVHKTHFDPNIGCKDCKTDSLPRQQITNEGYSPFRAVKQGYKHHAGSYWKLLTPFDIDSAGGITLTDTKGTWVKVSIDEATYEMQIKELEYKTEPKIEPTIMPIQPDYQQIQESNIEITEPSIEIVKPNTRRQHPSFMEDLKRLLFGK